jgi:CBS domain containing-hemolysin-like protein
MISPIQIILLVVFIILSAFFSGSEIALFSLSRLRIKYLIRKKRKGFETVERLKKNPQRLLVTILMGNNLVNIGASALATSIVLEISKSYAVSIATGIMTLIILVFGEITPKSMAARHNEGISLIVAKPLFLLQLLFFPVIFIFEIFTRLLTRKEGVEKPIITEDEIRNFISIGEEIGQIEEDERRMINRIFQFNDLNAEDVMIPRNKVVHVTVDKKIKEVMPLFNKRGHTRLIVCDKNLDDIKGFIHIMDTTKPFLSPEDSVTKIMRPIPFVPASIKLDSLLRFLRKKKTHIAVAVNETGTNIGLVTVKDIVEEVVGEIIEETEKIEPLIKRIGKKSYLIQGRADIDEINERCRTKLPESEQPCTISSFILQRLGRIPKEGETINLQKYEIKIKKIEKNAIDKIIFDIK